MNYLHQIRISIETTSPMAIQTGQTVDMGDNQIVTDVNDLPYIPATSFIGVWRNLVRTQISSGAADLWFGCSTRRALLSVTNGYIHDAKDNVVSGLVAQADIDNDPLLSKLQGCREDKDGIIKRDRNSINDRGVTKDKAKFEQLLIPTGLRFSFKIRGVLSPEEKLELQDVLALLQHSAFVLGSNITNGLGQFRLILDSCGMQAITLDENGAAHLSDIAAFNQHWFVPKGMLLVEPSTKSVLADIPVYCEGAWRMGSHNVTLMPTKGQNVSSPYREIQYDHHNHSFVEKLIAPGSSIKGIIAHRMLYHLNCINGKFVEQIANEMGFESESDAAITAFYDNKPAAFHALFGVKSGDEMTGSQPNAGALVFENAIIDYHSDDIQHRTHNKIDRFTGGVMDSALFSEEVFTNVSFRIRVTMLPRATAILEQHSSLKEALRRTFLDIETGRLPIGSHSGRGSSMSRLAPNQSSIIHPIVSQDSQSKESAA